MSAAPFEGRYLFVAGLHRTGTSLIARLVGVHPEIASIETSPAPENEGCYLQGGIPHTALHGTPGHYATDPAQHLVEGCAYNTLAVRERMEADWSRWFTEGGSWRVEKSPVNLTRTRLYQQLFPMAQFVLVLRHPAAMAAALAKWTKIPPGGLIDYALDAYETMERDARYLHCALTVRYEDLVHDPERQLAQILSFASLSPQAPSTDVRDGNLDYPHVPPMTATQAVRARRWGYGDDLESAAYEPIIRHPLRAVREACEGLAMHGVRRTDARGTHSVP